MELVVILEKSGRDLLDLVNGILLENSWINEI